MPSSSASHDITSERAKELAEELLINHERRLSEKAVEAFNDFMRQPSLSPRQRQWVADEAMRLGLLDEQALNLWSAKSPAEQARARGRDVSTPAVLTSKPLLPPGKRCIVCRGEGVIHPATRERCVRCGGTGREPSR